MRIYHALAAAILPLTFLTIACGDAPSEKPAERSFPVTVATVGNANNSGRLTAVGTVRFRNETPLGFTTAGKIATVRYDQGDRVQRGALLAALDTTNVRADFATAEAEQTRAQAEYQRMAGLFEDGWVTKARLEQAQAAARSANARVNQAGFATSTSRITAPSSGTILARNAEPGQVVAAGTAVLILGENDSGFVLRAPVVDSQLMKLSVGMPATVRLEALGGETLSGQISEIGGRADPQSGTFTVSVALPADARLRSGQIGRAEIALPPSEKSGEVTIPASALFDVRGDEALVYVVGKGNRVAPREVRVGPLHDNRLTIERGLKAGETIVVTGHERLVDGSKVEPRRRTPVRGSSRPDGATANAPAANAAPNSSAP